MVANRVVCVVWRQNFCNMTVDFPPDLEHSLDSLGLRIVNATWNLNISADGCKVTLEWCRMNSKDASFPSVKPASRYKSPRKRERDRKRMTDFLARKRSVDSQKSSVSDENSLATPVLDICDTSVSASVPQETSFNQIGSAVSAFCESTTHFPEETAAGKTGLTLNSTFPISSVILEDNQGDMEMLTRVNHSNVTSNTSESLPEPRTTAQPRRYRYFARRGRRLIISPRSKRTHNSAVIRWLCPDRNNTLRWKSWLVNVKPLHVYLWFKLWTLSTPNVRTVHVTPSHLLSAVYRYMYIFICRSA